MNCQNAVTVWYNSRKLLRFGSSILEWYLQTYLQMHSDYAGLISRSICSEIETGERLPVNQSRRCQYRRSY